METPRLRVAFGALRRFGIAGLRGRDLSPELDRRFIASPRVRTRHRSGSGWCRETDQAPGALLLSTLVGAVKKSHIHGPFRPRCRSGRRSGGKSAKNACIFTGVTGNPQKRTSELGLVLKQ